MHPETKKLTQKKHALSNTTTDRKSKATAKPWFSRLLRHLLKIKSEKNDHKKHEYEK